VNKYSLRSCSRSPSAGPLRQGQQLFARLLPPRFVLFEAMRLDFQSLFFDCVVNAK